MNYAKHHSFLPREKYMKHLKLNGYKYFVRSADFKT